MPTGIVEWARSLYSWPTYAVKINGARFVRNLTSVHTEAGYDQQTSTASFTVLASEVPFWRLGDKVEIYMGYGRTGGEVRLVFVGEIETVGERYVPWALETTASSYSRRLQRPFGNPNIDPENPDQQPAFSYNNITDNDMWNDLCRRAGVPRYDAGSGDEITYATAQAYDVALGTKLGDLIGKLDQSSKNGQRSFDINGVFIRRPVLGVPSQNVPWHYAEGVQGLTAPYHPIVEISRDESTKSIKNQQYVTGVGPADENDETPTPVFAVRQLPNDYVGKDGEGNDIYEIFTLSSDLLENREQCDDVAERYMIENNKVTDELSMKVALNPHIIPGQSVGVTSIKMGIGSERPYWVRHVGHTMDDSGAWTNLRLEGGAGPTGYLVGLPPVANFTMEMSQEGFEVGGEFGTWYTITADGSTSYDPDGYIAAYNWSSSNGATGGGPTFQVRFSQAEWEDTETPASITLTVTDADSDPTGPHTNTLEQPAIAAEMGDESQLEGIFVAAEGQAEASPDGGSTWYTWAPSGGAKVISVTRLAFGSTAYYGTDDGRLFMTTDFLASEPTLVWTHPSGFDITAVWVSEVNAAKIAVGDQGGNVYLTADAFATTVPMVRSFSHRINWIIGSIEGATADQQWRVATGSYVWVTFNDFVDVGTLSTQDHTVEQIELGPFGNYNAENVDGNVKVESFGHSITYPTSPGQPVHSRLAQFIRTDELMSVDDRGLAWVKAPGATEFTQVTPVGGGENLDLIASRINSQVFYAGAENGLYKTYDAGTTWVRVRDYTSGTLRGLKLGLVSEPVEPIIPARIVERIAGPWVPHFYGLGDENRSQGSAYPDLQDPVPPLIERSWAEGKDDRYMKGTSLLVRLPGNTPEIVYPTFYQLAFDDSDTANWKEMGNNGLSQGNWFGRSQACFADHPNSFTGSDILLHNCWMLFRHKFSLPANLTFRTARLAFVTVGQPMRFWLNETEITSTVLAGRQTLFTETSSYDTYYCDLPANLLVSGGLNIFAFYIQTRVGFNVHPPGDTAYQIRMNTSDEIDSETEGAYTYYVTTENAATLDLVNWSTVHEDQFGHDYSTDPIQPEPAGWEQPSYDDSAWKFSVGAARYAASGPPTDDTSGILAGSLALGHHSSWMGANHTHNSHHAKKELYRMHWTIPDATYTEAKLSMRYIHGVRVFFNGNLVFDGGNPNGVLSGSSMVTLYGVLGEQLDIDVLQYLRPGDDNVLAAVCWRERPPNDTVAWFSVVGGPQFCGICAYIKVK